MSKVYTEKEFDKYCTGHLVRGVAKEALRRRWQSEGRLEKPAEAKAEFKPLDPDLEAILVEQMTLDERKQYFKDKAEYEAKKKPQKNVYQRGLELLRNSPQTEKPKRAEDYEGFTFIPQQQKPMACEGIEAMSDEEIDALANMADCALD